MSRKMVALWALVAVLALMGAGTISNQIKINKANATLAAQAEAGQRGLTRQCKLVPIGKKLYAWAVKDPRSGITIEDYELVVSSADTACAGRP